jgi:gamma-glutamylputrescine oxidase
MRRSIYWQERLSPERLAPLQEAISCDFAIVGGGISGLSAAQALLELEPRASIVVLERDYCGAGATGASSGFITPDSESQVHDLVRRFGDGDARFLWLQAMAGCGRIRENAGRIHQAGGRCDLVELDSVYVATDGRASRVTAGEHRDRLRLGLDSRLYSADEVPALLGASGYGSAVRYSGTFAIDPFAYITGLRNLLGTAGVKIFESSPATRVSGTRITTPSGSVDASAVIVALDRFAARDGFEKNDTYQAQTALVLSEPLCPALFRSIFPGGPVMAWESDLLYRYFRPVGDDRILIGGGLVSQTYRRNLRNDSLIADNLVASFRKTFRELREVAFDCWWPGMIGVTKDFLPIAGRDPSRPGIFLAICPAGLPWGVMVGAEAARQAAGRPGLLQKFLKPGRGFTDLDALDPLLPRAPIVALSNYYAKTALRGGSREIIARTRWIRALAALIAGSWLLRMIARRKRSRRSWFHLG